MCGITAIFAYHYASPDVDRDELRRIRDHMVSRGPDGAREWFSRDGRVGMGHRRLSIIDLSEKAAQPMHNQNGSLIITYNGEIYNYEEIRENLERKGRIFQSHSDTEVLLHLYEEKGEAMVSDLRGMFAFALWDVNKNAMLLARDPYGIKPLYYADDGWTIRLASQVKALLAGGKVSTTPEPAGIVGFFLTGSVPEPFTTYEEIRQVPAGSVVWVDSLGPSQPKFYASVAQVFSDSQEMNRTIDRSNLQEKVREALIDSVRHHLVSDVPVGAFLSGGIDSGSLIGLAHDLGIDGLETITLAFNEFRGRYDDESQAAEEVSRFYGMRHRTRAFTKVEFEDCLPRFFEAMDQPTIDGINTYFVSKAAHEIGLKVALSGIGGDELFGGYPSFRRIPYGVQALAIPSRTPLLGEIFRHFYFRACLSYFLQPKWGGILKYGGNYPGAYLLERGLFMPWELETVLDRGVISEGLRRLRPLAFIEKAMRPDPKNQFARIATLEASLYMRNQLLRDADWAGMAHSLEIRTPFVDIQLLKTLAPILISLSKSENGIGKKKLLTDSLKKSLPKKVLERAKSGFSVPIEEWIGVTKNLDSWEKVPALARKGCHWARRWAYVVMERQKGFASIVGRISPRMRFEVAAT